MSGLLRVLAGGVAGGSRALGKVAREQMRANAIKLRDENLARLNDQYGQKADKRRHGYAMDELKTEDKLARKRADDEFGRREKLGEKERRWRLEDNDILLKNQRIDRKIALKEKLDAEEIAWKRRWIKEKWEHKQRVKAEEKVYQRRKNESQTEYERRVAEEEKKYKRRTAEQKERFKQQLAEKIAVADNIFHQAETGKTDMQKNLEFYQDLYGYKEGEAIFKKALEAKTKPDFFKQKFYFKVYAETLEALSGEYGNVTPEMEETAVKLAEHLSGYNISGAESAAPGGNDEGGTVLKGILKRLPGGTSSAAAAPTEKPVKKGVIATETEPATHYPGAAVLSSEEKPRAAIRKKKRRRTPAIFNEGPPRRTGGRFRLEH